MALMICLLSLGPYITFLLFVNKQVEVWRIFLTSFEVCCAEAQLEFKPITSQKDLKVSFLSPAMQVKIQHILFLSASTLLHLIASYKKLVSLFHPLPRQLWWPSGTVTESSSADPNGSMTELSSSTKIIHF